MYCKKCHTLIPDNDVICESCGYDNSQVENVLEETKEIILNPKIVKAKEDKKRIKYIFALLLIVLITGFIVFYVVNDYKKSNKQPLENTMEEKEDLAKEFLFDKVIVNYPSKTFGASKSTIFYKSNNAYSIEFKTILASEYEAYINSDFKNEEKLGNINTFTYSQDNTTKYTFNALNNYYLLIVNYDEKETLENTKIQVEMLKIINSLHIKE